MQIIARGVFMSKAKDFLSITSGAFLLALGTVHFAEEASIVSGGASGLAVAVAGVGHWFGIEIPLYLTTALLNIPLFLITFIKQGGRFLYRSLYATVMFTVFLWLCPFIPVLFPVGSDIFASAVMTGVFLGAGLILVINSGASTGGTDMLALIIQDKFPQLKITTIINVIDTLIILFGYFVFGAVNAFYGILSVFVTTSIMAKKVK